MNTSFLTSSGLPLDSDRSAGILPTQSLASRSESMLSADQPVKPMSVDRFKNHLSAADERARVMPTLYLASRSPRRRELLAEVGISARIVETGVDDGLLQPGRVSIEEWTVALAYFKARAGAVRLQADRLTGIVLGADTLVEFEGEIIGQPRSREHAREIIDKLSNATHQVITGIALVDLETDARTFICDSAEVTVGEIAAEEIEAYLDSGMYAGKAGAYNLADRIAAGWPIEYQGDPGTIMGLPLQRLLPHLAERYGICCRPREVPTPEDEVPGGPA